MSKARLLGLILVLLGLGLSAPATEACGPYVVGHTACPNGDPIDGVAVSIFRHATTTFPACDAASYSDVTEPPDGRFDTCVHCGYTTVDITIEGETRTQYITGYTDFGTWTVDPDADNDGSSLCDGDCDDTNPNIYPGHREICDNNVDDDCDGLVDEGCNPSGSPIFRKPNVRQQP